jgi:hypothetical protein
MPGLAARLAGGGGVPSVLEDFFRFGRRRAGRRCGRFRANPTHRASSKNAPGVPTPHPPPDMRRGAHPNRICAEVPHKPQPRHIHSHITRPTGSAPRCPPPHHVGCKTAWCGLFRPISVRVFGFFVIFWRFENVFQVMGEIDLDQDRRVNETRCPKIAWK